MSPLRLNGSTSGYSQLDAPAIAGDQTFTLPGTGGTIDRLNRAGNILQVVNATYATEASSSSSTFADTGLSASITPTSSTSKILVFANLAGVYKRTNDTYLVARLMRGASSITTIEAIAASTGSTTALSVGSVNISYLDSPGTTSATTYKVQFASGANSAAVYTNVSTGAASGVSSMTLMEVAA